MYSFTQVEERDIDMLFIRAFGSDPEFSSLFLTMTPWSGANVCHVKHSLMDPELGESDITVIVEKDGIRYGLLIENKINADAMPNQCARYHKRGNRGVAASQYRDYAVFIIAPQRYLETNPEAANYPNQISYETLLDYFHEQNCLFEFALLSAAIEKQESGYSVLEVPAVTRFWQDFYAQAALHPALEMFPVRGGKGTRASWPRFRIPLSGTALYFKARQGVVDLEFTGKDHAGDQLRRDLELYRAPDMHWITTGKSICLRIKVRPVDFHGSFTVHNDQGDIDLALDAAERLSALATLLNDKGYRV